MRVLLYSNVINEMPCFENEHVLIHPLSNNCSFYDICNQSYVPNKINIYHATPWSYVKFNEVVPEVVPEVLQWKPDIVIYIFDPFYVESEVENIFALDNPEKIRIITVAYQKDKCQLLNNLQLIFEDLTQSILLF